MKKLTLILCLAGVLLAAISPSPAFARSKKKKAAPPPSVPTISSVAADSITVADDNGSKTFAITQFTEVLVKGQRAKISDLQPGMAVTVTLGTDPTKASRVNASDPPKPAK